MKRNSNKFTSYPEDRMEGGSFFSQEISIELAETIKQKVELQQEKVSIETNFSVPPFCSKPTRESSSGGKRERIQRLSNQYSLESC